MIIITHTTKQTHNKAQVTYSQSYVRIGTCTNIDRLRVCGAKREDLKPTVF